MNYLERFLTFSISGREYGRELTLQFTSSFAINDSTTAGAFIFNPTEEIIAHVEPETGQNKQIVIDAGSQNDHGICVNGEIYHHRVEKIGGERVLSIKIKEAATPWARTSVSRTWQPDVRASAVVEELAGLLQLPLEMVMIGLDKTYPAGLTFTAKVRQALKEMVNETDSVFFIRAGRLYIIPRSGRGLQTGIFLSSSAGLLEEPEKWGKGWKMYSLFDYRIGAGECLEVESQTFSGSCKVIKGKHFFRDDNAYTEMEVVLV